MNERRSLTAAVDSINKIPEVDPEVARKFVTQASAERSTPRPAPKTNDAAPIQRVATSRVRPVGLIPVTVRLRPEIAGALKRASLERELAGETVYTQQDIVEQALQPWLEREELRGETRKTSDDFQDYS